MKRYLVHFDRAIELDQHPQITQITKQQHPQTYAQDVLLLRLADRTLPA
jgi:hypothetical protein